MIAVVDCGSTKTVHIEAIVDEFMDVHSLTLKNLTLPDFEGVNGVILSGAPRLVTEIDMAPILHDTTWIQTLKIPVLGICFGHQLIGIHHGAIASRMREDRDWQTIEILEDAPLFRRLPREIQMMEDHCEAISVPPNFQLIASSDACINEAMQHKSLPIFGVQFHPEVSGNHGRVVLQNFIDLCQPSS